MKVKQSEKNRILTTDAYNLFSYDKERIFRNKIDLLKIQMKEKNLSKDLPIIINEEYKILDGRHRFVASVELGLPIFYKVAEVCLAIDLLKATAFVRHPTTYDFLLAHKDKLFYRKCLEHSKLLPFDCDEIIEYVYGYKNHRHKKSAAYHSLVNGDCEFEKEYDYKVSQIDEFISHFYENYSYFNNFLRSIDEFLSENQYTAKIAIQKITSTQSINYFFDLSAKGHPEFCDVFGYIESVSDFENSHDDTNVKEEVNNRFGNGLSDYYVSTRLKYPMLLVIEKVFEFKYKRQTIEKQKR